MTTPAKYNIAVYEGASFRKRFVWKGKNARPTNLTGYSAILRVRATVDSEDVLLELSTANGGIVLFGTTGAFELVLSREAVLALTFQQGVYDLLFFAPDGVSVVPRMKGRFTVEQGVTR